MKLIIAGSRSVHVSVREIDDLVNHFKIGGVPGQILEVVSGTAYGIDQCGEAWADAVHIPIKRFPAQWDLFGKSAGHRRNAEMAQYADALLLIWDGKSRGSAGMKSCMEKLNKPVYEAVLK